MIRAGATKNFDCRTASPTLFIRAFIVTSSSAGLFCRRHATNLPMQGLDTTRSQIESRESPGVAEPWRHTLQVALVGLFILRIL